MAEECVKLYLAEQVPFTLEVHGLGEDGDTYGRRFINATSSRRQIIWRIGGIRCVANDGIPKPGLEKDVLEKITAELQNRELKWDMGAQCLKSLEDFEVPGSGDTTFKLTFDRAMDFDLKTVLGEGAFLQAEVFDWKNDDNQAEGPPSNFTTKEMVLSQKNRRREVECQDDTHNPMIDVLVPGGRTGSKITGKMNLIAGVPKRHLPTEPEKAAVFKRALTEEMLSDAVIVCENGVEIKCHRIFLAAHSDVFEAMFTVNMTEAQERRVEMADMTEEGVRASLAYLYHWDLSKAEGSFAMAVELLKAGHKYNIRSLEHAIVKLLMDKPDNWFEPIVAVRLMAFIANFDDEDWKGLKRKAVMGIKATAPGLLDKSLTYFQRLSQELPGLAVFLEQYML